MEYVQVLIPREVAERLADPKAKQSRYLRNACRLALGLDGVDGKGSPLGSPLTAQEKALAVDREIAAIKMYRERTGLGLRISLDTVRAYRASLGEESVA